MINQRMIDEGTQALADRVGKGTPDAFRGAAEAVLRVALSGRSDPSTSPSLSAGVEAAIHDDDANKNCKNRPEGQCSYEDHTSLAEPLLKGWPAAVNSVLSASHDIPRVCASSDYELIPVGNSSDQPHQLRDWVLHD